jgi:pyruvate dehydrogenase complex dehydrogenase (E1) component
LADDGKLERGKVAGAIERYSIDPDKTNPVNA